jgi:hypothetical protein
MRPEPPEPDLELDEADVVPPRRRHPRYSDPGLGGRMSLRARARIVDLSTAGIGLESLVPLPLDRDCLVRLADDREGLAVPGRSRWQKVARVARSPKGDSHVVYRSGVQFKSGSSRESRLYDFIDRNAGRPNGTRTPPRYELRDDQPASIEAVFPFEVRTLSRSGMRIRLDRFESPGPFVDLVLEMPEGDLPIRGRIVNSQQSWGERPKLELGIEFARLSEQQTRALESFLAGASRPSEPH